MLPDRSDVYYHFPVLCLNAPTGAWCSLTASAASLSAAFAGSQCTYRCVVLPDLVLADLKVGMRMSQCTYRCVVLPDAADRGVFDDRGEVSMHLQVRGAP